MLCFNKPLQLPSRWGKYSILKCSPLMEEPLITRSETPLFLSLRGFGRARVLTRCVQPNHRDLVNARARVSNRSSPPPPPPPHLHLPTPAVREPQPLGVIKSLSHRPGSTEEAQLSGETNRDMFSLQKKCFFLSFLTFELLYRFVYI